MLLLTFTAGSKPYAVEVSRIIEVLPKLELRVIPHAPALLAGLLSYRGQVVPVIDLGLLLDTAPCRNLLSSRMILVNNGLANHNQSTADPAQTSDHLRPALGRTAAFLGLLAENVNDLIPVRPGQIIPAPVQLANAPYLDAIVRTDYGIVPLIAVQKVRDHLLSGTFSNQSAVLCPEDIDASIMNSERENRVSDT